MFSLVLIGGLTQFSYAKILKEYCFPTAPFLPLPQRSSSRKSTSQQTNSKWSQQNCMQVERLTRWILIAIVSMDFHSLLANCGRFVLLFASLWDLLKQPTTTHTGILLIVLTHTHTPMWPGLFTVGLNTWYFFHFWGIFVIFRYLHQARLESKTILTGIRFIYK